MLWRAYSTSSTFSFSFCTVLICFLWLHLYRLLNAYLIYQLQANTAKFKAERERERNGDGVAEDYQHILANLPMNFGVQPCSLFTFAHLEQSHKAFYTLHDFRVHVTHARTHTNSLVIRFSSHGCIKLTKCRLNFNFMGCITQMVVTHVVYMHTIVYSTSKFNQNTFRLFVRLLRLTFIWNLLSVKSE